MKQQAQDELKAIIKEGIANGKITAKMVIAHKCRKCEANLMQNSPTVEEWLLGVMRFHMLNLDEQSFHIKCEKCKTNNYYIIQDELDYYKKTQTSTYNKLKSEYPSLF